MFVELEVDLPWTKRVFFFALGWGTFLDNCKAISVTSSTSVCDDAKSRIKLGMGELNLK